MRSKKNQQVYIRYFLILAHKTPFEITPITFTRAHNEKKNNTCNKFTSTSFTHFLAKIVLIHVSSPVGTHSTILNVYFVIVSVLRKTLLTVI